MGKKKNTFNYNKDRRKAWKKKKKLPTIQCDEIKQAWDARKSVKANLASMGLSADPNVTLKIPSAKELLTSSGDVVSQTSSETVNQPVQKPHVIKDLEAIANAEQPIRIRLADPDVKYCIYMIEKYGEDYKAMARDDKNYYQDTPKQIRRKILTFKSIPDQYQAYLTAKGTAELQTLLSDMD